MKNLITSLLVFVCFSGFSQSHIKKGMVVKETARIENISVEVIVDSAEESAFSADDMEEIFSTSSENETMSFKIICNGWNEETNSKSSVSYKIEGNTNERALFLNHIQRIRIAAIKYYNQKN